MFGSKYPGAFASLTSEMESWEGRPQVDDIIGLGMPSDAADCEAEYSGDGGMPLSFYYGGEEGVYPGPGMSQGMSPGMSEDPMQNEQLRGDLADLLGQRAQQREANSAKFQESAAAMAKAAGGGFRGF